MRKLKIILCAAILLFAAGLARAQQDQLSLLHSGKAAARNVKCRRNERIAGTGSGNYASAEPFTVN